jgi:glycosyltransferase involved in cell wall biosynthesis
MSKVLQNWIRDFEPDIIYAQAFRYKDMSFAIETQMKASIPMVIHIMDDSVSYINTPNLLFAYWNWMIKKTFVKLIESASVCLSISQAMSDEYLKRYNKLFVPFRNPIEIELWIQYMKKSWAIKGCTKIIYTGRLAVPNIQSLLEFCKLVNKLNNEGFNIEFDIYSNDMNMNFIKRIDLLNGVNIKQSVLYSKIPELLSKYDIAFLPIDFNDVSRKYAQFSISTKTSEYMISGLPVLLYAPEDFALTKYANNNKCMAVVSERDENKLSNSLIDLIRNEELRSIIAKKAIEVVMVDSNATKVRNDFFDILSSLNK